MVEEISRNRAAIYVSSVMPSALLVCTIIKMIANRGVKKFNAWDARNEDDYSHADRKRRKINAEMEIWETKDSGHDPQFEKNVHVFLDYCFHCVACRPLVVHVDLHRRRNRSVQRLDC